MTARQRDIAADHAPDSRGKARSAGRSRCSCTRRPLASSPRSSAAYCRYSTGVSPRLSEFAILVTARLWRAQYEWYAHVPRPSAPASSRRPSSDLQAGRAPKSAPKDERAIYDFIQELYKTRRVSDKTYKRVNAILGDAATVEFVGILGYYMLISMTSTCSAMPLPEGEPLPFPENVVRYQATRHRTRATGAPCPGVGDRDRLRRGLLTRW